MKKVLVGILVLSMMANLCALAGELPHSVKVAERAKIDSALGYKVEAPALTHKAHIVTEPTRYLCADCGGWCATVCRGDATYDGTSEHGWFRRCTVKYFTSYGSMMCMECHKVWKAYYSGYHDCWEIHSSCGKGYYDICPMDIS